MNKEKKEKHFLHKPQYKGGVAAIKQLIAQHLQYPEEAIKADVEGTVHLRYNINHKGVVTGAKIISGIGHGCDKEAIRLVKLLKFDVAKNRGVRAVFHKTIRIHFRKPKKKKVTPSPTPAQTTVQYSYTSKTTSNEQEEGKSSGYNYTIKF